MRHSVKRIICLSVLLCMLLTLSSVFTLSTVASSISSTPMIAVGDKFMVVQTSSGNLWGWGDNSTGVLGQSSGSITSPVQIQLPDQVLSVSVSAGANHILAIGSDGNVYAWGNNEFGQLGTGNTTSISTPTVITGLRDKHIVSVSAGNCFSLALDENGNVYSFGKNNKGQLGYASATEFSATPARIEALDGVTLSQISAGDASAIAINTNGKLYTWGTTANGVLGESGNPFNQEPLPLADSKASTPIIASALSTYHSVHLLNTGKVGLMGWNQFGQFGNGSTSERLTTVVKNYTSHPDTIFTAIAASYQQTVLLAIDGTVYTAGMRIADDADAGSLLFEALFADQSTAPSAIAIAAGYANGAMIAQDGAIWTWGDNSCGQLANGRIDPGSQIPNKVVLNDTVVGEENGNHNSNQTGNNNGNGTTQQIPGSNGVLSVPIQFTATVPAPTYSIVIPSNVDIGELQQADADDPNRYSLTKFTVEARNVDYLFGENAIQVSVNAQEGSNVFCLQNANGTSLPFDLLPSPTGQNTLQSGDVLARFTANSTVEVWIRIDRSQISQTGTYEGVLTFRYSVVEINNEEEQR